MEGNNYLLAFMLTLGAGLATGIGSLIAFFAKKTDTRFLSVALGFSAGVMIYVSMIEIFQKARETLVAELGTAAGNWAVAGSFFLGMFIIALIDRIIPEDKNPHGYKLVEEGLNKEENVKKSKLLRTGTFTALAIAIHNFPEGLATFTSALKDPGLGVAIAFAIAIHNIPEGIAVSVPMFYATGNRKKSFLYSFLSGLSEPVGAVIGFLLISSFFNEVVFGVLFASVAGIMVFISLDELLPSAREYGEAHLAIYGLIAGMMVMAASLLLFI